MTTLQLRLPESRCPATDAGYLPSQGHVVTTMLLALTTPSGNGSALPLALGYASHFGLGLFAVVDL